MSLEETIDDNNWKFEEVFIEIEEELRDNYLSEITKRHKEIDMGIYLRALNKKQFCIVIYLILEDHYSGEPLRMSDAGIDIDNPYEFEDLCDAVYLYFEDWAKNGADHRDFIFDQDIANALIFEDSKYEFYGSYVHWNQEIGEVWFKGFQQHNNYKGGSF